MNCYYSNLIEGHDTHPVDIERALKGDYSKNSKKRELQLEARAHIAVQQWIDTGGIKGRVATREAILEIHKRFCTELPEELPWVEDPKTQERIQVIPGAASPRRRGWLSYSNQRTCGATFPGPFWSIARGLARNVDAYKGHLAACDLPRRNDLDGRGTLSEEALVEFTQFFLATCLDQVTFMERLMQPGQLCTRILLWAEEETRLNRLPSRSANLLEALLYHGELPRGGVAALLNTSDRQARRVVSALQGHSVLKSDSSRAPLRLAFPATLASRWMP